MKLHHKQRKIMALILVPLSFTFICYLTLYMLISPVVDPLISIYNLIASDYAPELNNESSQNLYKNKLVSSDVIKASQIIQPNFGDMFGKLTIDSVNIKVNLYYGDYRLKYVGFAMGFGENDSDKYLRFPHWILTTFDPCSSENDIVKRIKEINSFRYEKYD